MMDETMDQEVNTTTDTLPTNTNNFTQIQSRKYRSTTTFPCYKLCPSMDLLVLGSSSSSTAAANTHSGGIESDNNIYSKFNNTIAESITVHRIISWNSLLTLKIDELTSGPKIGNSNNSSLLDRDGGGLCVEDIERDCTTEKKKQQVDDDDMDVEEEGLIKGATSVCWSPNGRYVAIGLVDGGVLLHTVEPDAAAEASSSSVQHHHDSSGGTAADGNDSALMHIIRPPPPNYMNKPSLLSPTAGIAAPAGFVGGAATTEDSAKKKKKPNISPRVTRSMRAAREGGGASGAGSGTKSSRRSKSPGGSNNRRPNLKVDVKNSLQSTAVIGMVWNRLLSIQKQKKLNKDDNDGGASSNYEQEVRETWKYSSQLIDRGDYFLPSTSKPPSGGTSSGGSSSMNLFSSMAHLNVLCVATPEEIHWYLQGQYRILSIPHGLEGCSSISGGGGGIDLVCSPDLSTLLAVTKQATSIVSTSPKKMRSSPKNGGKSMKAKLFNTYLLPQKRFELQVLSASYKSIFTHLWDVQKGIQSALTSWKSALRPLDNKFKGLLQLLAKYSLDNTGGGGGEGGSADSIRLEFLRFILSGRSTVSSNTSSALDQFFTRAQMHDQLLQREIRGIEASVAAMEGALRSHVLSSIRAVVYEAEELYGLAKAQQTSGTTSGSSSAASLIDANTALCLYNASRILFLTFDQCLGYVVEARTRLHDLLSWIRSTASQVRAWGTATDSIQRKNARSRRVSNGVVQRVAAFLSNPMLFALDDGSDKSYQTLTECVLGVPLSDFFVMGNTSIEKELHTITNGTKPIRSIKSALQTMMQISTILFDKPRNVFAQSLSAIDISFEAQHTIMSIHTRIGAGANAASSSYAQRGETSGFFLPKTPQEEDDETIGECPYWTLLARSLGPNQVELIAIPGSTSFGQEDGDDEFYLRSEVMIPEGYEVTNIAFYGDDGNSSLSPDLNEESKVREGRQSVGFVIKYIDTLSQEVREELWLFQYDDITFQKFKSKKNVMKNEITIPATAPNEEECTFLTISDDEDMGGRHCIDPKRRHICTHRRNDQVHQQSQVNLCGSRGTGGVITFDKSTYLNIFDLEEDEDNDSV